MPEFATRWLPERDIVNDALPIDPIVWRMFQ